jgi:cytoskeletal protein RodZ
MGFMMRGSFTKKKIGTLTLGEKLRKLRSDRRITLTEASRITKIQVKYIELLEEGDYNKLPADVYVRGFLRSYAEFLGVDDCILIKLYEKEKGIKKNLEKTRSCIEDSGRMNPISVSSFVFTPKKIMAVVVSFLVFLTILFLYREIGSFTDAPRLVILSPTQNAEVGSDSIEVWGRTDKDVRIFINDQSVLVNDDGNFKEKVGLQAGINNINIRAINRFDKEAKEQITVKANIEDLSQETGSDKADDGEKGEEVVNSNDLQMELRVDPGPVWVSVETDGNLVFSGNLLSGVMQSFSAKDKISISSGKANATFLKFNGKDIGALGPDSKAVKGVVFDKNFKY